MIYGLALVALAFDVISAISSAGKPGGGPALSTAGGIRNVMNLYREAVAGVITFSGAMRKSNRPWGPIGGR